ncbi:MAG TPA: hypothetical protein VGO21_00765 [Candidatus Paceibacterota bacterium]|jgi:hypothetical protein|nr:hypothetical protein [Candidatus Paceibacterota bacterium]
MKRNKSKIILIILAVVFVAIGIFFSMQHPKSSTSSVRNGDHPVAVEDLYTKNLNDLLKIVQKEDPNAALHELQRRMDTDPYVFKNCHAMAHEIGHAGYKKYNDFAVAMSYQDATCSDGYLHGVIEERFAGVTDIYGEMKKVCLNYTALAGRCYHGVGHGIMFYTANDLPKALTICGTYAESMPRGRCYEGVFMENFISGTKAHPSSYLDPKNPMYPCPSEPGVYKSYCYFYTPYYFLRLNNNDYTAAIKWCASAEPGYQNICVRGVGSIAMKFSIKDPKSVEKICNTAIGSIKAACIDGMVSYYLTFTGNFNKVKKMCTTLELQNQTACYNGVKRQQGKIID